MSKGSRAQKVSGLNCILSHAVISYPSMSGSNDTKLRWCWWCTSGGGVICLVRLELSDPKGNWSFARHFTELFSLSDLLICPRILFRCINLMARIVIAAVKIAPRNSPPVEFGELFLRDLDTTPNPSFDRDHKL